MENFQRSWALPNIKYNCVVLFLSQLYLLFIYAFKYFLIDHHCKSHTEFSDLFAKGKIYWCSRRVFVKSQTSTDNLWFLGSFRLCQMKQKWKDANIWLFVGFPTGIASVDQEVWETLWVNFLIIGEQMKTIGSNRTSWAPHPLPQGPNLLKFRRAT